MEQGVPERDLLLEKSSRTTLENLQQAHQIQYDIPYTGM